MTASLFESAVEAVIAGDLPSLVAKLAADPSLVHARSAQPHRATLLHYVAANGVEDERQHTPPNAVRVAETLLAAGAAPDALAETYGGGPAQTPLNLLVSSCHPANAGLQVPLVDALLDGGAAIEGVANDGSPLLTALAFCYTDAAVALARRGARIDTVVAAAGLGRVDLVRDLIEDGTLRPDAKLVDLVWLRLPKEPRANLELALHWAAMHGHPHVVELLTSLGVRRDARDQWGRTS